MAKKIQECRKKDINCIYGPFTKEQAKTRELLKGGNIMPHFIRTTLREDGTEKLREVTDASSTRKGGKSFNDNIKDQEKNLKYIAIIEIIRMIKKCKIEWMVMGDAQNAFKRLPIEDRFIKYFGVKIATRIFYWTCATYGGASSCRIYGWFAAYVVWIIIRYNKDLFTIEKTTVLKNYLDDFFAGHRSYLKAWMQYYTILAWFAFLGIPTQERKMNEPTKILKYIGYIINIILKILEIPMDKLIKVKEIGLEIIQARKENRKVPVRKLQSFCGIARFITPIYYYIIPLLRNVEEQIGSRDKDEMIKVSALSEKDIRRVIKIVMDTKRNKISFDWLTYPKNKGDIITETDASGNIGIGGVEKRINGIYFQVNYRDIPGWTKKNEPDIVWKELVAVLVMHKLQKKAWKRKAILLKVDNKAVEHIMIKKKACFARKDLQSLVGDICEHSMRKDYWHWYGWISSDDNGPADGLSRNKPEKARKCIEKYKLRDKSKKAKEIITKAYKEYKEVRKIMEKVKGDKKECDCKNKRTCDDQELYAKWVK